MPVSTGLSGAAAIALVQEYSNEPTFPTPTNLLGILNRAVSEVDRRTGAIRLYAPYPTVNAQTTVQLNNDILSITSASFSMGNASANNNGNPSPFAQGTLVYPMFQMSEGQFMDAAAGLPAVGFGPPQAFFLYQDQGQAPSTTLPAPPAPQLTVIPGTSNGLMLEAVITYVNANGESTKSPVADFTPDTSQQVVAQTPPAYTNALGFNVYVGAVGGPYYLQNTAGYIAIGSAYTIPGTPLSSGTQPPGTNTATGSGQGGALSMQLYPAAMIGQINVYYIGRSQLWADTTANSYTNLDDSAQEAVIFYAVMRVLNVRGRSDESSQIWKPQYDEMIETLKESVGRRTRPPSGQVRDVRNRAYPNGPFFGSS